MVRKRQLDEPAMSDRTLLLSVEDLIHTAFGTSDHNVVNFVMLEAVLHILARQMRLLEQDVEIKIDDIFDQTEQRSYEDEENGSSYSTGRSGSETEDGSYSSDERDGGPGGGRDRREGKSGKDRDGGGSKDRKGRKGGTTEKEEVIGSSKDRDKKTKGERGRRGAKRGDDRDEAHDGERGGARDGKRGGARDGKRGGARDGKRSKARDGERGGEGFDESDETRDGERGGARDGKRRGARGKRGGARDGERGGEGYDEQSDGRGKRERGGKRGERDAGQKGTLDSRSAAAQRGEGREGYRSSITVTEAERKGGKGAQDKVLLVEKGPSSRSGPRVARVGSIEVVTASQFALLEKAVNELTSVAGPLPTPALPDNEKLRKDLVKGKASLTDTMQAMQLNKRMQAAEEGLNRMAGLMTQLAAAGVLPQDVAGSISQVRADQTASAAPSSVRAATSTGGGAISATGTGGGIVSATGPVGGEMSVTGPRGQMGVSQTGRKLGAADTKSRPDSTKRGRSEKTLGAVSRSAGTTAPPGVTRAEMEEYLQMIKENLLKDIAAMTSRATQSADNACHTSKAVAEQLNIALLLDKRVTTLFQQTADYAEQLSGFDSGVTSQMASFHEQMGQMHADLKGGLALLEQANNNAETAAISELTERYESLVIDLDGTMHMHQSLIILQKQLDDELRSLIECVELLREQKADTDEVFDGLRDKADISRLTGLLHEVDFALACEDLERRLALCYEKFMKQDKVWLGAIKDLMTITEGKAEVMQLMIIKDKATDELRKIEATLRNLFMLLGEPQAAILTRKLAKGAVCGSCMVRALMDPQDPTYGKPAPLPELRPRAPGDDTCFTVLKPPPPIDERKHVCHRWVGGSHTLLANSVPHEQAEAMQLQSIPTKRYAGYGNDGRLYMLEEALQPCAECNIFGLEGPGAIITPLPSPAGGEGDSNRRPMPENAGDDKGDTNKDTTKKDSGDK